MRMDGQTDLSTVRSCYAKIDRIIKLLISFTVSARLLMTNTGHVSDTPSACWF
jgi:hypothetical protein